MGAQAFAPFLFASPRTLIRQQWILQMKMSGSCTSNTDRRIRLNDFRKRREGGGGITKGDDKKFIENYKKIQRKRARARTYLNWTNTEILLPRRLNFSVPKYLRDKIFMYINRTIWKPAIQIQTYKSTERGISQIYVSHWFDSSMTNLLCFIICWQFMKPVGVMDGIAQPHVLPNGFHLSIKWFYVEKMASNLSTCAPFMFSVYFLAQSKRISMGTDISPSSHIFPFLFLEYFHLNSQPTFATTVTYIPTHTGNKLPCA